MSEAEKTRCDLCHAVVDGEPSGAEPYEMKNYTIIDLEIKQRNPKKRKYFVSNGALCVCSDCVDKAMTKMSIRSILNKIAEEVEAED